MAINITLKTETQSVLGNITARTSPQREVAHYASHAWVNLAVFLLGTEEHLASHIPTTTMSAVSSLKHIFLPARVAADSVAQNVGLKQIIISNRVPFYAMILSCSVRRLPPHCGVATKTDVRIGFHRCQEMPSTLLQDKRSAFLLPIRSEIEMGKRMTVGALHHCRVAPRELMHIVEKRLMLNYCIVPIINTVHLLSINCCATSNEKKQN